MSSERPGDSADRFATLRLPRGRHGLAPASVAENQHWRLLTAAGEVLVGCGYGAISSRQIARRARVSSSAFYHYFDNVDDSLQAAHQVALDCLWDLISAACTGTGEWSQRLLAALEVTTAFLVSEPAQARLLCADVAAGIPGVAVAREGFLQRLAGLLCGGRELRLSTAGELPAATETHLVGAAFLLLGDRVRAARPELLSGLAPELAEILRRPYVAQAV